MSAELTLAWEFGPDEEEEGHSAWVDLLSSLGICLYHYKFLSHV